VIASALRSGKDDFLVSGDKGGLLALDRRKTARIITAGELAAQFA